MTNRRSPGAVRDAILEAFKSSKGELTTTDLKVKVEASLGGEVASSSIRSYLNLNTPGQFIRTGRGTYRLVRR